jgi:hypothetical protein
MESGISGSLGLHEGGEKGILSSALGRVVGKWYYTLKEKKRLSPRWLDGRGSRQTLFSIPSLREMRWRARERKIRSLRSHAMQSKHGLVWLDSAVLSSLFPVPICAAVIGWLEGPRIVSSSLDAFPRIIEFEPRSRGHTWLAGGSDVFASLLRTSTKFSWLLSVDSRVVSCATLGADMEAGVASSPESRRHWSDRLDPMIGNTGYWLVRERTKNGKKEDIPLHHILLTMSQFKVRSISKE